ncbi:putative sterigmatocystin biosynthesis monooxygenase stcW [Fonsecaea pedrosoi]|nr:putative sterigmatocystin biosynthesis monooxygenase stcW [Fonsecaea pedrosoi]
MVFAGQLHFSQFKAPIIPRAIDDPGRKLRVVTVGAGISGVTTAIRLPQHLGKHVDLQIYEKNSDIGGVWLENKYPGVACDIPAPCFQFLFENNPNWSKYYASGQEICSYVQGVAQKFGVRKYMKFNHRVTNAEWNEEQGKWHLMIKDLTTDKEFPDVADVLVLGWGMLNNWEWPKVKGLHSFKGPYMHSANYDTSFDPTGKRVAVVGGGSTGIQILPHIQKVASHVDHYMRSRNWIAPIGFGAIELEKREALSEGNFAYTAEEKRLFNSNPDECHRHRREVEEAMNDYMTESGFTYGTPRQQAIQKLFDEHMKKMLETKPEILESMLPSYPPGCRRLTPGPGYLEALVQPNVNFINKEIDHVEEKGIVTEDGVLHEVDAIIWCTGFNVDFVSRFPMKGRNGVTWDEVMDPEPECYLGSIPDQMPNCHLYMGPNCGAGAGGSYIVIEGECELLVSCLKKMLREKIKSMSIKPERLKQYVAHVNSYLSTSIFGQPCKSWFKRGKEEGRNLAYYCGNALNLLYAQRHPRWEDFDYTYLDEMEGNPMSWLGNGYTLADYSGGSRTNYLDPEEIDFPPLPTEEEAEGKNASVDDMPLRAKPVVGAKYSNMRPLNSVASLPHQSADTTTRSAGAVLFGRA